MSCTYDQKEFCLFKTYKNSTGNQWQTSSQKSSPVSFSTSNYIFIKNNSPLSKIRSFVISDTTSAGQCLIFNYYTSNNSRIILEKVDSANFKEVLFKNDNANSSNFQ